jgi:hypothetical protein
LKHTAHHDPLKKKSHEPTTWIDIGYWVFSLPVLSALSSNSVPLQLRLAFVLKMALSSKAKTCRQAVGTTNPSEVLGPFLGGAANGTQPPTASRAGQPAKSNNKIS